MTDGVAWLFCPADRPDRFEKAAAIADVVILDLEDGVLPADRPAARGALLDVRLDPERTVVRVNPHGTKDHRADIEVVRQAGYRRVMLAKTESAEQAASVTSLEVIALCETPRGVLRAADIAECPAVHGVMWGAEDLVAGLGGRSSRIEGAYRDVARFARSHVLLAAGASSKLAIDAVYLDFEDVDGLAAEAADAVQVGFGAKACIHPSQVAVVRAAYLPTEAESAWARRVVAAARSQPGVFRFEGQMVDEPVIRQARAILARAASP